MRRSTHIWVTAIVGAVTGGLAAALRPNLLEALGLGVLVGVVIGTLAVLLLRRRARYRFGPA